MAAANHERRPQKLQEILDERMALTDWKKLQGLGYQSGSEFINMAKDRTT
jgi:hypothetical protein